MAETGFVAESDREFMAYVQYAFENRKRLGQMSNAARAYAMRQDWDSVFRDVFAVYSKCTTAGSQILRNPDSLRRSGPLRTMSDRRMPSTVLPPDRTNLV